MFLKCHFMQILHYEEIVCKSFFAYRFKLTFMSKMKFFIQNEIACINNDIAHFHVQLITNIWVFNNIISSVHTKAVEVDNLLGKKLQIWNASGFSTFVAHIIPKCLRNFLFVRNMINLWRCEFKKTKIWLRIIRGKCGSTHMQLSAVRIRDTCTLKQKKTMGHVNTQR